MNIGPQTTRGLMGLAGAVIAGGISAALFAVAMAKADTMFIFIAYLTAIPLFIAGLGAGSIAGLIASLTGTAGLFVAGPSNFAFVYSFVFAVPAIGLTALALRTKAGLDPKPVWYPEGQLLTAITVYPCLIFLVVAALTVGHPGGLLALTTDAFNTVAAKVTAQLGSEQAATMHTAMERAAQIAPALVGSCWIFVIIISMAAAQALLKQQGWQLRDRFGLRDLRVPNGLIYAVALIGLVGTAAPVPYGYLAKNVAIMLGLPFFLGGLAVIHAWAATTRAPALILIALYIVLSVVVWLALLVAALGVIDQWADFRRRLNGPRPTV